MKLLILTLFIFPLSICCASSQFEVLKDSFSVCLTLTEFEAKLEDNFNDFKISRANDRLTRNLDFGFSQIVYEIQTSYKVNAVKYFRVFLIITKEDSIVLGNLQELDYVDNIDKAENYIILRKEINNYLTQHKIKYGLALSETEFIKQLTELLIYGFGCSEGGVYFPPEAIKMLDYVENNNYKKLAEWLRQINPELQAYAIDGLTLLEKKGMLTEGNEKELILNLVKRNSKIYHCSGCIYGISTTLDEIIKQ